MQIFLFARICDDLENKSDFPCIAWMILLRLHRQRGAANREADKK